MTDRFLTHPQSAHQPVPLVSEPRAQDNRHNYAEALRAIVWEVRKLASQGNYRGAIGTLAQALELIADGFDGGPQLDPEGNPQ